MRAKKVNRSLLLLVLVAAGAIAAYLVVYLQLQNQRGEIRRQAAQGTQALTALCALRGDLAQRVHQANDFLRKHPNGAFGFTRAEILTSRDNQQRTVDALAGLNCPSTKEH